MTLPTPVSLCGSRAFARRRPRARHLLLLVAVAGSLVLSGAARSDMIVLENGHRRDGRIESESADAVVLARGSGTLTIDRRRIAAIERDEPAGDTTEGAPAPTEPPQRPTPPPRTVPTRFAPPPAAKDGIRLARWARSCWLELGYPEDISALLTRVVEDPSASPSMLSEARRLARSERLAELVLALDP